MKRNKIVFGGFTLVEMLIVVAIIVILAAILFPVMKSAREEGTRTVVISNLRQCMTSLTLYQENNGDLPFGYPDVAQASKLLQPGITWDPGDPLRPNKNSPTFQPGMIGSFAYVLSGSNDYRNEEDYVHYLHDIEAMPEPPILADIFHPSGYSVGVWEAAGSPNRLSRVALGPRALFAFSDGHVEIRPDLDPCMDNQSHQLFHVGTLFFNQYMGYRKSLDPGICGKK